MADGLSRRFLEVAAPKLRVIVSLPEVAGVHVEGSQPLVAVAIGVDDVQVIEDQHFTVALRRMTDDCSFSTEVRRRDNLFDVLPEQHLVRLLLQGKIRHVVGMHEKVRISLMEPHTVTEKCQMVLRNILDSSAVAGDGGVTAVGHPKIHVFATILELSLIHI